MKRVLAVTLAVVAVFALAACGGGDGNNHGHGNDHDHDHGHGDAHGKAHPIGEKKIGAYDVHVARVENESKTEAIYEVEVFMDGKPVKDVPVDAFIGDTTGKEQSIIAPGKWMDEEKAFDCHVTLPKDVTGMRLWVRLRPAGSAEVKGDFDIDEK